MPRGVPWDDLPNRYEPTKRERVIQAESKEYIPPLERDYQRDLMDIARRTTFGVVVRTFT